MHYFILFLLAMPYCSWYGQSLMIIIMIAITFLIRADQFRSIFLLLINLLLLFFFLDHMIVVYCLVFITYSYLKDGSVVCSHLTHYYL